MQSSNMSANGLFSNSLEAESCAKEKEFNDLYNRFVDLLEEEEYQTD